MTPPFSIQLHHPVASPIMDLPRVKDLTVFAVTYWLPILAGHVMITIAVSWKLLYLSSRHLRPVCVNHIISTHACTQLTPNTTPPRAMVSPPRTRPRLFDDLQVWHVAPGVSEYLKHWFNVSQLATCVLNCVFRYAWTGGGQHSWSAAEHICFYCIMQFHSVHFITHQSFAFTKGCREWDEPM